MADEVLIAELNRQLAGLYAEKRKRESARNVDNLLRRICDYVTDCECETPIDHGVNGMGECGECDTCLAMQDAYELLSRWD
jgi:hypothetical protein